MAHYVCSDLHGMMVFYKTIKEFIQPEDTVYFLGDAGDRGPQPWECIKTILDDPQFIYIKGNHEDMLVQALGKGFGRQYNLLRSNGGEKTFKDCMTESDWAQWRIRMKDLPTKLEYVNTQGERIILSHAGFTPHLKDDGTEVFVWDEDLIWSRDHFFHHWPEDECFKKTIIVHGHTPVPYLLDEIDPACQMGEIEPGALWYDNGRKCCIDCGAVFTGYCVLLNLDTWEEQVFQAQPYL
jgi:calcineurin-like phosphoesterase family protein